MPTLNQPSTFGVGTAAHGGLKRFADEVSALAQALMNPSKIIGEVEQMHALHVQADRIEAADPDRAAALRRLASRIGRS